MYVPSLIIRLFAHTVQLVVVSPACSRGDQLSLLLWSRWLQLCDPLQDWHVYVFFPPLADQHPFLPLNFQDLIYFTLQDHFSSFEKFVSMIQLFHTLFTEARNITAWSKCNFNIYLYFKPVQWKLDLKLRRPCTDLEDVFNWTLYAVTISKYWPTGLKPFAAQSGLIPVFQH